MLLKSISPFISVDKIIKQESEKYIHFITHLDDGFVVPDGWSSVIYTSGHIARFLTKKKNPIPSKFFKVIYYDKKNKIVAPDKTAITVVMFGNDSYRGNVMYYFKGNNVKIIYSGPFTECRSVLINPAFREYVVAQIDELYVDNTKVHCSSSETLESVASAIFNLSKEYPEYKIMLNIPAFGYEDLLYVLAHDYRLKVFVGSMIKGIFKVRNADGIFTDSTVEAKIIVGEKSMSLDDLKRWFERRRFTVVFYDSNYDLKNMFVDHGLYHFNYSWHPSLFELYTFISYVKPVNVFGIYSDMPDLPNCLKHLCKKNKIERRTYEQQENIDFKNLTAVEPCIPNEMNDTVLSLKMCNSRGRIELPRKVTKSQFVKINDELIPPVAIIRPRTIMEDKTVEEAEVDISSNRTVFNESLSIIDASLEDVLSESMVQSTPATMPEDVIKVTHMHSKTSGKSIFNSSVTKRRPIDKKTKYPPNPKVDR